MAKNGFDGHVLRMLVVEDDPAQLHTISAIMTDEGFEVIDSGTASEALEHLASGGADVAIVDLRLPDMSESELLARLGAFAEDVPIILNTGYASFESARGAVNIGAFAYVQKAGDPAELVRQVHRAIQVRLKQRARVLQEAVAERTRELLQTTEALREAKDYTESIIDSMVDMLVVVSPEGRIVTVNDATCELLGYSQDELIGQPSSLLFEEEEATTQSLISEQALPVKRTVLRQLVSEGSVSNIEKSLLARSGEKIPALLSGSIMRDGHGQIRAIVCLALDITERKRLEAQLLQSQKMEAVGQLAGGVAHDFRNQLTVVKWGAERLLRKHLVSDDGRGEVEEIIKAADASKQLTDQLLAFSRKEMLSPEVVDLAEVVRDLGTSLPAMVGEDIRLSVAPGAEPCMAKVDPGQLRQAAVNLVINARDAMPSGGELTIRTACVRLRPEAVRARGVASGRYAVLSVSDTGVGMDDETKAHIFDPFYTTKDVGQGTGLGLSMVYGFVSQSNGFVEVDGEPGKGSTFSLHFPCVTEPVPAARPRAEARRAAGGSETILLVEDEEALRRLFKSTLEELGYTVLEAADPLEAQSVTAGHAGRIDALVTDVVMPEGRGTDLAVRMRELLPGIAVVYISGYGGDDLARRGLGTLNGALLRKPFALEALARSVRQALDRAAVREGGEARPTMPEARVGRVPKDPGPDRSSL